MNGERAKFQKEFVPSLLFCFSWTELAILKAIQLFPHLNYCILLLLLLLFWHPPHCRSSFTELHSDPPVTVLLTLLLLLLLASSSGRRLLWGFILQGAEDVQHAVFRNLQIKRRSSQCTQSVYETVRLQGPSLLLHCSVTQGTKRRCFQRENVFFLCFNS